MDLIQIYGLAGKRALACGSSQGIGRASAMQFAALGAEVTLVARDETALKKVRNELPAGEGQQHRYIVANFDEPAVLAEMVRKFIEETGPMHVLLNNSGGPPHGPITEARPEEFISAMNRLLISNQLLTQAVLPGMKSLEYGRIINIISTSVKEPIPGLGVSNTTRWAIAAWAKTTAGEVAKFGITVNNILPGYTDTARLGSLIESKARAAGTTEDAVTKDLIARIPMARLGRPEEIAAAAGFLASPAASYVTGINLTVDGGRTGSL